MKKQLLTVALAAVSFGATSVEAAETFEEYDQTETAIFGSGNINFPYTTVTAENGNLRLGLLGRDRFTAAAPHVDDVYGSFLPGLVGTRAHPQTDWFFDVDPTGTTGRTLASSGYTFLFGFDTDPSQGESMTYLNALTVFGAPGDNSYGDFDTLSGQGQEIGPAGTLIFSKVANSWNLVFGGVDYNLDAHWAFELQVWDGNTLLASADIEEIVGAGGAPVEQQPVPEPSTVFGGIAIVGMMAAKRFRDRKKS